MEDDDVATLPEHILHRIDKAFDEAYRSVAGPSSHSIKSSANGTSMAGDAGGGFIVEEAGGFILDDDVEMEARNDPAAVPEFLPFSAIPTGLQLLDLQPDDEEVLNVFRSAASGWGGRSEGDGDEVSVSRKDWRAVCAVLVDREEGEPPTSERSNDSVAEAQDIDEDDDDEASDVFAGSVSSLSEPPTSDEEFEPTGESSKSRKPTAAKGGRKRKKARSEDWEEQDENGQRPISERQKVVSEKAFALFFPTQNAGTLNNMKLTAGDVAAAAKTINEKLTSEEIKEMLEAFSSSADESMSLGDFERMMVATKLA